MSYYEERNKAIRAVIEVLNDAKEKKQDINLNKLEFVLMQRYATSLKPIKQIIVNYAAENDAEIDKNNVLRFKDDVSR